MTTKYWFCDNCKQHGRYYPDDDRLECTCDSKHRRIITKRTLDNIQKKELKQRFIEFRARTKS